MSAFVRIVSMVMLACCCASTLGAEDAPVHLLFSCAAADDLYRVVTAGDRTYPRFDTPAEAVAAATEGAGVLILADGYPVHTTPLDAQVFELAAARKLRLYVGYPSLLPGMELGTPAGPRQGDWGQLFMRAVVTSDACGPALEKMRIRMVKELLTDQVTCGAIRTRIVRSSTSNEAYGTDETSPVEQNGDPVSDLLYESNFALVGLHEAAAATGNAQYREAEDKLAEYICRIQAKSETHPEFDGVWYRGFDYQRWQYWAADADVGWSVWSTETGWTQAEILICVYCTWSGAGTASRPPRLPIGTRRLISRRRLGSSSAITSMTDPLTR